MHIKSFKKYKTHFFKLLKTNNYEDIQLTWFQNGGNFLSHIEVLDRKQEAKGFK